MIDNDKIIWLVVLADYLVGAVFVFGALYLMPRGAHKESAKARKEGE